MQDPEFTTITMNIKSKILSIMGKIYNGAVFYAGWLVCMQQAPGPHPYFGPLFIVAIIGFHFVATKSRKVDAILVVCLALIGTVVDSLYIAGGMIIYQGGYESAPWLAPLWITSLWALYAISVNHSLSWMRVNLGLAAIMGGCGAISSYLVGIKLGAAKFLYPDYPALGIIGAVWAIVVPLSLLFSRRLKEMK